MWGAVFGGGKGGRCSRSATSCGVRVIRDIKRGLGTRISCMGVNGGNDASLSMESGAVKPPVCEQGSDSSVLPLSGVRVLDMGRILAAPYCSMLLGDLGAEIIKVEALKGDDTRQWGPPFLEKEQREGEGNEGTVDDQARQSAYFLGTNRNKKSIAVDFKTEAGKRIIKELAAKSDILLENFVPGQLAKVGLGYEDMQSVNPRLIYCSITGFGSVGPYAKRPGVDVIVEALGGFMWITGEKKGAPVKAGVAIIDVATGLLAKGAILGALYARERTGNGEHIECSLLETQISALVNIASNYLIGGLEGQRWGTAHESIVPYEGFRTAEGHIVIGAINNSQYKMLCKELECAEMEADKFATNPLRVENRVELKNIIEKALSTQPASYWFEKLGNRGIIVGPINNLDQVFNDPHVQELNMVEEMEHAVYGSVKTVRNPVTYRHFTPKATSAPPVLGEHTREILGEILCYSPNEIESLVEAKVVKAYTAAATV
eukprot:Nk52_evm24s1400 gene=Nk52_evmTU24s1400